MKYLMVGFLDAMNVDKKQATLLYAIQSMNYIYVVYVYQVKHHQIK